MNRETPTTSEVCQSGFKLRIGSGQAVTIVKETNMVRKGLTLGAAAVLLLAVDWLAFHDIREPHTFRDYLTLVASMLVFFRVGWELVDSSMVYSTNHPQR